MPLSPGALLAPPYGSGDLNPRAVWPWAYEATGGGLADVEAALRVYLEEGYARGDAVSDDSARAWARYRALKAVYDNGILGPLSITTDDGFSVSMTFEQLKEIKAQYEAALALSTALLGAPSTASAPLRAGSGSFDLGVRY